MKLDHSKGLTNEQDEDKGDGDPQVQPCPAGPEPHGPSYAASSLLEQISRHVQLLATVIELVQVVTTLNDLVDVDSHVVDDLVHLTL